MNVRMVGITLLLGAGVWLGDTVTALTAESPVRTAGGAKYEHKLEKSRFDLGGGVHHETDGPFERAIGVEGVFLVDDVTGATLAVRNSSLVPKPPLDGQSGASDSSQSAAYPQPLTEDPEEHTAAVRAYLVAAGIPEPEVSGTHVTTTMAGGGPVRDGFQPSQSKLLWYTTHLERSLGGIPVEGSYAFAALDSAGNVITEGVYWPAIPASVAFKAQVFAERLASPGGQASFFATVRNAQPDLGDALAAGEVKVVHTPAGYHGRFQARAVYSTVVPSPGGGKAQIRRFDETGAPVRLDDEVSKDMDSMKQK
jgi:hypothetical protein